MDIDEADMQQASPVGCAITTASHVHKGSFVDIGSDVLLSAEDIGFPQSPQTQIQTLVDAASSCFCLELLCF